MLGRTRLLPSRLVVAWRIVWTIASLVAAQTIICGISALPAVLMWRAVVLRSTLDPLARWGLVSFALVPSYVLFATCLLVVSPLAVRLLGWHTPADTQMRIKDMDWKLLRWVRYVASIHLVRLAAGSLVRGTPIWTAYLRLSGARLGKRVYVNSLALSDYNLLEFGDDVVIGGAVHMAGHTVEGGVVKTARVRLGDRVTIGLNSVIEIGVEIGSDAQVGAMSFVPKHAKLAGAVVYAGCPAVPLPPHP